MGAGRKRRGRDHLFVARDEVTRKQITDIVKTKGKDLNARNDEAAFKIIVGTARQMGLEIVD